MAPRRLVDHLGVLIEQHLLDVLLDRHPVGTGHAAPPFVDSVERADDHRRRVGRNHVPSDLDLHHATGRDPTTPGSRCRAQVEWRRAGIDRGAHWGMRAESQNQVLEPPSVYRTSSRASAKAALAASRRRAAAWSRPRAEAARAPCRLGRKLLSIASFAFRPPRSRVSCDRTDAVVVRASDRFLVAAAQAGDLHAFEALVRRHQGAVYRVALRRLGSGVDAEDAAQEALVQAWRALSTFRGESAFSTW